MRPDHADSARELGVVLTTLKRNEEAIAAYQHAVSLQPDSIQVLLSFGERLQEARRFEEAAAAFGKVVDLDPNHCNGWLCLGAALLGLNQYADSLAAFRRAQRVLGRGLGDCATAAPTVTALQHQSRRSGCCDRRPMSSQS